MKHLCELEEGKSWEWETGCTRAICGVRGKDGKPHWVSAWEVDKKAAEAAGAAHEAHNA